MITAIAQLGRASREESGATEESDIRALVEPTGAASVIALKFKVEGNCVSYVGLDIEEKGDDILYIYKKERGRETGLFLTNNIKRSAIKKLRGHLTSRDRDEESQEFVEDFLRNRLDLPFQGRAVATAILSSNLQGTYRDILISLIDEVRRNSGKIHSDFCRKIEECEPEEFLLTPKLIDGTQEYFIGQIPEYVKLFRMTAMGLKDKGGKGAQPCPPPVCTICNGVGLTKTFKVTPLPFFTTDKPSFVPYGDESNKYKVFPLCQDCFRDLQHGRRFIEDNLDFSISPIEGRRGEVSFWLIPILNDYSKSVFSFVRKGLGSNSVVERRGTARPLYIRHLKSMCDALETITEEALDAESDAAEAFLMFTALFYTKDRDHVKLILSSEGIYPAHLRFMLGVKKKVDSLYPFKKIGVRFGFPLLREFLTQTKSKGGKPSKSEGWYKDLASILGDMFVGKPVNKPLIYRALAKKIWERAKEANLETIMDTAFKALSVVEYIEYLESPELEKVSMSSHSEVEKHDEISQIKRFMDDHKGLLSNDTLRAVCATGMATGILLEVQRRRSEEQSMPFWGKLNRLEMDLERVRQLFPQIVNKLHEYNKHRYDDVIAYLGSEEISRLDWSIRDLPGDVISLAFAVGMAQGYWIAHEGGGE